MPPPPASRPSRSCCNCLKLLLSMVLRWLRAGAEPAPLLPAGRLAAWLAPAGLLRVWVLRAWLLPAWLPPDCRLPVWLLPWLLPGFFGGCTGVQLPSLYFDQ